MKYWDYIEFALLFGSLGLLCIILVPLGYWVFKLIGVL